MLQGRPGNVMRSTPWAPRPAHGCRAGSAISLALSTWLIPSDFPVLLVFDALSLSICQHEHTHHESWDSAVKWETGLSCPPACLPGRPAAHPVGQMSHACAGITAIDVPSEPAWHPGGVVLPSSAKTRGPESPSCQYVSKTGDTSTTRDCHEAYA